MRATCPEVCRQLVEKVERNGDSLDRSVLLPLEIDARLEEDDTLVLFRKHLHERLHEVLADEEAGDEIRHLLQSSLKLTLISSQVSSSASSELK